MNPQHEMRTWLSQIIGFSEVLLEETQERGQTEGGTELRRIRDAGYNLLRLIEANPPTASVPSSSEPPSGRSHPVVSAPTASGLVLIVDDDEANRELLTRRLTQEGYTVRPASDGAEALRLAEQHPPDLVLLDLLMPGMDGAQVLQRLKEDTKLRHIPVIMLSAMSDLDSAVRCIDLGAEDYLPKPLNPVLLRARISASLEKKRLRDLELRHFEELQEKHRQLHQLEALRDELVHLLLHDLRTPLTTLTMGLHSIGRQGPLNERQQRMVTRGVRSIDTMLGMLNDVLNISRMEGGVPLNAHDTSVTALLEQTIEQVQPLAVDREVTLLRDVAPDLPMLRADEELLRRALVNLLSNAIRFTPAGGIVTATVQRSEDNRGFLFWVRDTGPGVAQEQRERIFDKFGQASLRRDGTHVSMGLGLTFCKMTVEAHGGRIWLESELGHGSTFYFLIPDPA